MDRQRGGWLRRLLGHFDGNPASLTQSIISQQGDVGALRIAPEVRASVHDDGLALLHIPTGQVFLGNRTALRIWQGIVKGLSVDAICDDICCEYSVAREVVQPQTRAFVLQLERTGLLTAKAEAKA